MLGLRVSVLSVAFLTALCAQDEGMIPRWQVEELAEAVVRNMGTARKVVVKLQPGQWVGDVGSEIYVDQHAALLRELGQAELAAAALGREPDRLSYAVDTFLWLERTDSLLGSMASGVRRYYNTAVADLLDAARNRNADGIATVKQYMRQLAVHVEESMRVAHAEAQRCRAEIVSRPGAD